MTHQWLEWEEEWCKRNPELVEAMQPRDPSKPPPSFADMMAFEEDVAPPVLRPEFERPIPNADQMIIQDVAMGTASGMHPMMPCIVEAAMEAERAATVRGDSNHNQYCRDDWAMYNGDGPRGMGPKGDGCVCSLAMEAYGPKLWEREPDMVTHIAGACLTIMGLFMRQRCDWCGIVLLEYDLRRVAVPVGQDPTPGSWTPGAMVRIDGSLSAEHEPNVIMVNGEPQPQLPADSCCFDPKTQVK